MLVLLTGLVVVIIFSEVFRRKHNWSIKVTRKFVHILTGVFIAVTPFLLESPIPLLSISGIFIIVNLIAIQKGWMPGMHATAKVSYGTVFYPISFFILIYLLWNDHRSVLVISMLIMAIADAGAAIVGENIKSPTFYQIAGERKSLQGSLAMFVLTFLITFIGLIFFGKIDQLTLPWLVAGWYSVVVALFTTACESVSYKGSDNLSVPLGAAFVLTYLILHSFDQNFIFTLGMVLAFAIAYLSMHFRFLSASGAVATFLLGAVVFGIGKWEFSIPILLFFFLSSMLSKMGKTWKKKFEETFQKGGRRDIGQVFANGGIAGIIVILWNYFPNDAWYFAFIGSVAAVTADTWSTEIGVFSKKMPRDILRFKPVMPGTSGAVSLLGTMGGFFGSFLIVFTGSLATNLYDNLSYNLPILIIIAGLLGSVVDSIIGSTVQAQYKCPNCGKVTEKKVHCQTHKTELIAGVKIIDNDLVNAACALSGALFAVMGYYLVVL